MHRIPTIALAFTLTFAVPSDMRAQQAPDTSPAFRMPSLSRWAPAKWATGA